MIKIRAALVALGLVGCASSVAAMPTPITVRVLARNGKLVGDPAGGASVVVRDTLTGAVLASGKTTGGSGDTQKLLDAPQSGRTLFTGPGDAAFSATIDLDAPRRITVEVGAPGLGAYGGSAVSQTQWVLPGKAPQGPNGWVLELPGFMVDILKPGRHEESLKPVTVPIEANVVMMCGCPVEPGGAWDSTRYQTGYTVTREGRPVASGTLSYAGVTNRFRSQFVADSIGVYDIVVTVFDPASGNSGVAETTFEVDQPSG